MTICNCSNCGDPFTVETEGLVVTNAGKPVAGICGDCCKDVRVGKIVVRKPDVGTFVYEQWSPMEMTTSGLSTAGKRAG